MNFKATSVTHFVADLSWFKLSQKETEQADDDTVEAFRKLNARYESNTHYAQMAGWDAHARSGATGQIGAAIPFAYPASGRLSGR